MLILNTINKLIMKITGEQLNFLIQVLRDSLEIQMGYDWTFKYKKEKRKEFYQSLIEELLSSAKVQINKFDVSNIEKINGNK